MKHWIAMSMKSNAEKRVSCSVDKDDGAVEEDMEQITYQEEFEEEIVGLDKDGGVVEEDTEQIIFTGEIEEEIAGSTSQNVFRQLTGKLVTTENGPEGFTGEKTRFGRWKCSARGLVLRNKMVVKNFIVFVTLVVTSPLQGVEMRIGGNFTEIWQDVSAKRRRFGVGTERIT